MTGSPACTLCGHPADAHPQLADGTRPCRSVGHPNGLTCTECIRITSPEHVQRIQEARDMIDPAWAAFKVTLDHARTEIGPGWQAFFTDVYQSALASAIIAHEETVRAGREP
jgi:hypothetical protein